MIKVKNFPGLKVFIHVGVPKGGSTSFQNALQGAGEDFLCSHRISYLPDGGSNNNSEIYKIIQNQDCRSLINYIFRILEYAVQMGAENIIISCETLFNIDNFKEKVKILLEIFDSISVQVEFLLVIRELQSHLNSYLRQNLYNGSISLDDTQLASWVVGQMMGLVRSGFAVRVLQFEDLVSSGNLPSAILQRMGFPNILLTSERANVTPDRPLLYALAEGTLARLEAIKRSIDINSLDLDIYRTTLREKYDAMAHRDNSAILQISSEIENEVARYIDDSIASMPDDCRRFYDELRGVPELFVPRSLPVIPADPLLEAAARHVRATNWLKKMRKGVRSG